jgi:hypothetical protein
MRRASVLNNIKIFLEKNSSEGGIAEIYFHADKGDGLYSIWKNRSVFVTGISKDRFTRLTYEVQETGFQCDLKHYKDPYELDQSDLLPRENNRIENNWRGRILRYGKDFDFENIHEKFNQVFLQSYFRLMINRHAGDFFSRFDIVPLFYSPGYSAAGSKEFRIGIKNFIEYIDRPPQYSPVDPNFDFIRVFYGRENSKRYEIVKIFNSPEVQLGWLLEKIRELGPEGVVESIHRSIKKVI